MNSWAGTGEAYAASYAALCAGTAEALAEALGPPQGRSLLDVGSGTGQLAAILHERGWEVTGCEPELSMRDVAAREHPGICFTEGALPDLPFEDGAFDAVTANFVLNHVSDPRHAARELARVAKTEGSLAATTWLVSPSSLWTEVIERSGLKPAAERRLAPELDFERSTPGFAAMLRDAHWQEVQVSELTWVWRASPHALWTSVEGGVASAGAFYLGLSTEDRTRFRDAFDAACADRLVDDSIPLQHTAALAVGQSG